MCFSSISDEDAAKWEALHGKPGELRAFNRLHNLTMGIALWAMDQDKDTMNAMHLELVDLIEELVFEGLVTEESDPRVHAKMLDELGGRSANA